METVNEEDEKLETEQGEVFFDDDKKPQVLKTPQDDKIPFAVMAVKVIGKHQLPKPLLALFDPGSTSTWINRKSIPEKVKGKRMKTLKGTTVAGNFVADRKVALQGLCFPEFNSNRELKKVEAMFFKADCRYDVILGRDALRMMGIKLDFARNVMTWDGETVAMKVFPQRQDKMQYMEETLYNIIEEDLEGDWWQEELFSFDADENDDDGGGVKIKQAKYDEADIHEIVQGCKHLTQDQRNELEELLLMHPGLFDGKLKKYTGEKIHLDLRDDAVPHTSRHYSVPRTQMETFKAELDRLVKIGVLSPTGRSEWIAGSFIIPKKDGSVRWISDFRALNKALRRKCYPIPKIQDILSRRSGYKFLSKLDVSMQYYTFELDDESKDLCTIATPFGLYKYNRLPMGVSQSPDIAQEVMEKLLKDLEDVEVYIDDLALFSQDWNSHLEVLGRVLSRLESAGFVINPRKCEWGIAETEFLGHWLTPSGVKPYKKKVDAILKMKAPTNIKELRSFLGLVTYYRDMWPRRSHVLAPLTDLMKTPKTFSWDERCQKAFDEMKALVVGDALLAYPDHNLPFEIETDASDFQLGAVIKQQGRPVAYYSRKLNQAQKNYSTIEKELLSIVETLKEFKSMLLGARIRVFTDHQNLTHKLTSFQTQRVTRWRLLLEEFSPSFHYLKGSNNLVADALSRVPTDIGSSRSPRSFVEREKTAQVTANKILKSNGDSIPVEDVQYCMLLDDPELADCFLVYPYFDSDRRHPFRMETIAYYQKKCEKTQALLEKDPKTYQLKQMGDAQVLMYCVADTFKVVLTDEMLPLVVKWLHKATAHAQGVTRLESTLKRTFYNPKIASAVRSEVANCTECQKNKKDGRQYGDLAPREVTIAPWQEVHVDCIGPWTLGDYVPVDEDELDEPEGSVHVQKKRKKSKVNVSVRAMTMIDPVTNLLEIARIRTDKGGGTTSLETARVFENTWLSRYPKPLKVVCDNGPEFQDQFKSMLAGAGIDWRPTSKRNSQSNGIIESVHRTVGQVMRTLWAQKDKPETTKEAYEFVDMALATSMHATRCAAHSSLDGRTPGSVVFRRDMFMDFPLTADIVTIQEMRQQQVNIRTIRANAKRIKHEFKVGDQVMVLTKEDNK